MMDLLMAHLNPCPLRLPRRSLTRRRAPPRTERETAKAGSWRSLLHEGAKVTVGDARLERHLDPQVSHILCGETILDGSGLAAGQDAEVDRGPLPQVCRNLDGVSAAADGEKLQRGVALIHG